MAEILSQNSLLALFLTIGVGYAIGKVNIRGFQVGIAAVLFVGLFIGGLSPSIRIDDILIYFGLGLFIYSVGLGSGPSFFSNLNNRGVRDFGLVVMILTLTLAMCIGIYFLLPISAARLAGLYAGSTTNTASLAGLIDLFGQIYDNPDIISSLVNDSVSAFSLSYPLGMAGTVLALILCRKLFKISFRKEEEELRTKYPVKQSLVRVTVLFTNENLENITIRDIKRRYGWKLVFGRYERNGEMILCSFDTDFKVGDKIVVVGDRSQLVEMIELFGEKLDEDLSMDQENYVTKRIFVSRPDIAGKAISTLNIQENYSAIITRVQRGDMDLLASSDMVLELGDMVRFVVHRRDLKRLQEFFGDSYESLGKINLFSFAFGLAVGLFLGMITFSLPGDVSFRLGFAGGPMIVALILGRLRRTGNLVWIVPYGANQIFQQLGLALLLAGIGINSGHTFFTTVKEPSGLVILGLAGLLSFASAFFGLAVGYKVLKIPYSILVGMVSHQPAILDYNLSQTGNKLPVLGFTLMMPVALILKIIFVQMLFLFLN